MAKFAELVQSADWKREKHAPVIEVPDGIHAGEPVKVVLSVGKEHPHPNTVEHHISWMEAYLHPTGEKFPHLIGRFDPGSHGESVEGSGAGALYSEPSVEMVIRTVKEGVIHAVSYCNIHGLWVGKASLKSW